MPQKMKYTIEDMKKLAAQHGGKCLSEDYLGVKVKLIWECSKGHSWPQKPANVLNGQWCQRCSNAKNGAARMLTFDELGNIAAKHGGKCLSTEYLGANRKYEWECAKGHTWEAKASQVKAGHWCPKCAKKGRPRKIYTIEELQVIAEQRGGKCLSTEYKGSLHKVTWECAEGHVWDAPVHSIIGPLKTWCHKCANKIRSEKNKKPKGDGQAIGRQTES